MQSPIATVIIPNYNGRRFLPELRNSLRLQSERRFQVIVVDDASKDESTSYFERDWPEALLLRNSSNLGFAASCNRGLEAAETDFVVLLNNDTYVDVNWMAEGLAGFSSDRIAAAASLILLAQPPHLVDTAGDVYSIAGGAAKRCHLQSREGAAGLPREIFSACGASAFYRRDILARIGNLDATLMSYYDDVDIGFRLAWAGYDCTFAPQSICYHQLSASHDPRGWNYHFNSARNAEIIWQAYMPPSLRAKYRWSRRLYLAAQALYKLRLGCLRAHIAGRRAAREMHQHVLAKQLALTQFRVAAPETIESRLSKDWRRLHFSRRGGAVT